MDRQTHLRRATHLDGAWTSLRDPVTPTTHSSALDVSAFPYSASAGPERLATRPDRYPVCRAQVRFSAARQRFRGGAHRRYFRAAEREHRFSSFQRTGRPSDFQTLSLRDGWAYDIALDGGRCRRKAAVRVTRVASFSIAAVSTSSAKRRWPNWAKLPAGVKPSSDHPTNRPSAGWSVCGRRRPHGLPSYFRHLAWRNPFRVACRRCQQYDPEEAAALSRTGASDNPGTPHTRFTLGEIFWCSRTNCTPRKSLSA